MHLRLLLLLLLATAYSYGQTAPSGSDSSRHSVHVELAGRTFLFGSVNYEYAIWDQFSVGAGLGLIRLQAGEITRDNNGSPETGRYFDTGTSQMLYGTYFIGKHQHNLLLTAGISNFLQTYRNRYPTEVVQGASAQLSWNAGIGYQYSKGRGFFRATGYLIDLSEPSEFLPRYLPWLGLSGGIRF